MLRRRDFLLFSAISIGSMATDACFAEKALANVVASANRNPIGRELLTYADSPEASTGNRIEKVFPVGLYAQSVLFSLDPGKVINSTVLLSDEQRESIVFGGRSEFDQLRDGEADGVSVLGADLVLDVGDARKGVVENEALMSSESEVPSLFFDGTFEHLAQSYARLGALLNVDEVERQVEYIDKVVKLVTERRDEVYKEDPITVFVATAENGIRTATYNYLQANVFDYLNIQCVNNAVAEKSRNGYEEELQVVNLDYVASLNPDYVLFRDAVPSDLACTASPLNILWRNMPHVKEERFYFVPRINLGWLGAPLVSQCLGILWLGSVLRPNYFQLDVSEYAAEFYQLFAKCEITAEDILSSVNLRGK